MPFLVLSHLLYIQFIKFCPLYFFKMRSVSTRGLTALLPQLLHGNPFHQVQNLSCTAATSLCLQSILYTACMYDHLFNGFLLPLGQNHNSVLICLSPKVVSSLGEGTVVQFIIKCSLNDIYWMDEWECLHWSYSMAKPKSFFLPKLVGEGWSGRAIGDDDLCLSWPKSFKWEGRRLTLTWLCSSYVPLDTLKRWAHRIPVGTLWVLHLHFTDD